MSNFSNFFGLQTKIRFGEYQKSQYFSCLNNVTRNLINNNIQFKLSFEKCKKLLSLIFGPHSDYKVDSNYKMNMAQTNGQKVIVGENIQFIS